MPKDGEKTKNKKQKKNCTLGRIQRDKDFLARRKKKKTIKSKTRGHKKPLVNNRQHESADSEMGGNTWWKNKVEDLLKNKGMSIPTYKWSLFTIDLWRNLSKSYLFAGTPHSTKHTHRHTQVHIPMQIAFCICFQCSLLTLWRILQKSLSPSAAIQGDLFLPHRV